MPTPGHTDGHQSLVIRRTDGTIVVAGQSHDTAASYGIDVLKRRDHGHDPGSELPAPPAWIDRLQSMDPRRVVFAHDNASGNGPMRAGQADDPHTLTANIQLMIRDSAGSVC